MRGYPTVYLALGLWIPICIVAFATMRAQHAALVAFVGGTLLLPERRAFDFAGLPAFAKMEIASLGALLGCLIFRSRDLARARVGTGLELVVLLAIPFCLATVMTNRDPTGGIRYWAPGLRPYDVAGMLFRDFLLLGVPFAMGRALFRTPESLRMLMRGLVAAGLAYSVLVLWEARMSPQLHSYLYGFGQHSFKQTRRLGGWRPMVFMTHGLALSLFVCVTFAAAIGLHRAREKVFRMPGSIAAGYLGMVLLLCRSLASIMYGLVIAPVLLFARPRTIGLFAAGLALVVVTYPILRASNLFPTEAVVSAAAALNESRAKSLNTRFTYEDGLIARARSRIWFGWGGFGRATYTDESTRSLVTDGYWINRLGEQGAMGLGIYFALVLIPIFQAWRAIPRCPDRRDAVMLAALSMILAIQTLDTIPNFLFNQLPLLVAGAVSGLAVTLPRRARVPTRTAPADGDSPTAELASRELPAQTAATSIGLAKGRRGGGARSAR